MMLLATYKTNQDDLSSGKMSAKKFWERVSAKLKAEGFQITGLQCKSKLNGLKKTYKTVKDHNNKSGNNRKTWKYFDVVEDIFGDKPWVNPKSIVQSSDAVPEGRPTTACEPPSKRSKQMDASEQLLDVMRSNALRRVKMQQEAMERQDKLLDILPKAFSK